MSTDDYMLAIDPGVLAAHAARAACHCGDCSPERVRYCAAQAVREDACICLRSCPQILDALESEFRGRLGR